MEWLKEMLSATSANSSARVVNFFGAICGTGILGYATYKYGLDATCFATYLGYCGGVYGVGKYLDTKAVNV